MKRKDGWTGEEGSVRDDSKKGSVFHPCLLIGFLRSGKPLRVPWSTDLFSEEVTMGKTGGFTSEGIKAGPGLWPIGR